MEVATEPLVSVIVPFFNAADTIALCLQALESQDDCHFEVVVVDDGSTDAGSAIAGRICDRAGFKLVRLEFNKGQAVARNEGVRRASGALLAFVDADVVVPGTWVSAWRSIMSAPDAPDAACGGYVISRGEPPAALFASHEAFFRRQNLRSRSLKTITTASCVVRRAAFEAAGGFPEYYVDPRGDTSARKAVAANEDSELGFLMSGKGFEIRWVDSNPVHHLFRPTWKGYMRQQKAFAWSGTVSVFRFPGILFVDDLYSGERVIPQLVAALLMLASPAAALAGFPGALGGLAVLLSCLVFFAAYHRRFFAYLRRDGMGFLNRFGTFFRMVAARFVWLYGVGLGIVDGSLMRLRMTDAAGRTKK